MKISTFLTINSLILAVLLVWANLFFSTHAAYPKGVAKFAPALGLFAVYETALVAIVSIILATFAIFGANWKWSRLLFFQIPIALFGFTLLAVAGVVFVSFLSISVKIGMNESNPLGTPPNLAVIQYLSNNGLWVLLVTLLASIMVMFGIFVVVRRNNWSLDSG